MFHSILKDLLTCPSSHACLGEGNGFSSSPRMDQSCLYPLRVRGYLPQSKGPQLCQRPERVKEELTAGKYKLLSRRDIWYLIRNVLENLNSFLLHTEFCSGLFFVGLEILGVRIYVRDHFSWAAFCKYTL